MTYAKIGNDRIQLPDELGNDLDAVKNFLAATRPEVKNATIRQKTEDGDTVIEFLPQPGRKG